MNKRQLWPSCKIKCFFSLIKNISILFPIIRCRPTLQVITALFIRVTDFFFNFPVFFSLILPVGGKSFKWCQPKSLKSKNFKDYKCQSSSASSHFRSLLRITELQKVFPHTCTKIALVLAVMMLQPHGVLTYLRFVGISQFHRKPVLTMIGQLTETFL